MSNPRRGIQAALQGVPNARAIASALIAAIFALAIAPATAQLRLDEPPEAAQGVDVTERLGETIPKGLRFTRSDGELVSLDRYFDGEQPVVLVFAYYDCPVVCPLILDRLFNCYKDLDYVVGEDFKTVVVSFDHTESTTEAYAKSLKYLPVYNRTDRATLAEGWTFHTGDEGQIRQLADAVGYNFKPLPNGEYSHPVALVILSPDGKITRYIYGFDYPPRDVKLSLLEATEGKIAKSIGDSLAFLCYRYDPNAGGYTASAMAIMRVSGIATVIALVVLIGGLLIAEKTRRTIKSHSKIKAEQRAAERQARKEAKRNAAIEKNRAGSQPSDQPKPRIIASPSLAAGSEPN